MSKQQVHIRLSNEVYLRLKANNVNISDTANKLFENYLQFDSMPKKAKETVIDEMKELSKEKDLLNDKINKLSTYLVHLEEKEREDSLKEAEKSDVLVEGLLRGGFLND